MTQTILITGSTDGIGLETAKRLVSEGHHLILHGRSPVKLADAMTDVRSVADGAQIDHVVADLSRPVDVAAFAIAVVERFTSIDVLMNNAGVFKTPDPITPDGLDIRFAVNTIAPYLLTQHLLPIVSPTGRVINLSSAAQAPVDLDALRGLVELTQHDAYAQSKLAITMWSRHLADQLGDGGPAIIAVNPGSLLATKMVKEGYGIDGKDMGIGADILVRAAVSDEFATATGCYFDNDSGRFAAPHPDALNPQKNRAVVSLIDTMIDELI